MVAEIIAIGTELLLGDVVNTNATFISKELSYLGIDVHNQTVVGDNQKRFMSALEIASKRADIIITSGGLGPTFDDRTKETIAEFLSLDMHFDEEVYKNIEKIFNGRFITENNKKQAYIPKGSIVLHNKNGTAPGVICKNKNITIIMLPGPPHELEPMFLNQVAIYLKKEAGVNHVLHHHNLNIFGIGESAVEDILGDIMLKSNNPSVAPYASMGELILRVTAFAKTKEEAETLISPTIEKIQKEIGEYIYGIDAINLEKAVVDLYSQKKLTISTAESCTGGLLASRIVSISGSSEVFLYGVVSYSNISKEKILKVEKSTLEKYGAVSKETAISMARGVRKLLDSDIGVSTTGIAGPTGGSETKPVGLVYIAISTKEEDKVIELNLNHGYDNSRDFIRFVAASHALKLALDIGEKL